MKGSFCRAHFSIRAAADPQAVPRLLNHFAQLGLVPSAISMSADDGGLELAITQECLAPTTAQIIAEKMRASFLVQHVSLALTG